MITIPIGVIIIDEIRIQGELVLCVVIGGSGGQVGSNEWPANGIGFDTLTSGSVLPGSGERGG